MITREWATSCTTRWMKCSQLLSSKSTATLPSDLTKQYWISTTLTINYKLWIHVKMWLISYINKWQKATAHLHFWIITLMLPYKNSNKFLSKIGNEVVSSQTPRKTRMSKLVSIRIKKWMIKIVVHLMKLFLSNKRAR